MRTTDKKAKVVMLPTEKASKIHLASPNDEIGDNYENKDGKLVPLESNKLLYTEDETKYGFPPQHLYIISDEKIKQSDWIIREGHPRPVLMGDDLVYGSDKKIIATTDSLTVPCVECLKEGKSKWLSQPSESFIKVFIEEYNKGNVITDVMVEYVDNGEEGWSGSSEDGEPVWNEKWEVKVNRNDNTIKIRKQKDYSESDVIELLTEWGVYLGKKKSDSESYLNTYRDVMKDSVINWGKETGKF